MLRALVFASAVVSACPVSAQTSTEMLHKCMHSMEQVKPFDPLQAGICLGFIMGFTNGMTVVNNIGANTGICFPSNLTYDQLVRVYFRWLETNPKHLHLGAGVTTFAAFKEAFPCR